MRVEAVMEDAAKWFRPTGADVAEIDSLPHLVQEASPRLYGGKRLRLGWLLDHKTTDPETGMTSELSSGKTRAKVMDLSRDGKPYCIILSPMCITFSPAQNN